MQLALVLSNDQDKGRHVVTLDPGKSQVTLGRDESNDIVLNDKHVSRLHIRIAYSNSRQMGTCVVTGGLSSTYCF